MKWQLPGHAQPTETKSPRTEHLSRPLTSTGLAGEAMGGLSFNGRRVPGPSLPVLSYSGHTALYKEVQLCEMQRSGDGGGDGCTPT